jgi:hypothetical protein
MYAGWWSPTTILATLLAFSVCGLIFHATRALLPYAIRLVVALRSRRRETPQPQ